MSLPEFAVKRPVLISMFFLGVLILGIISLTKLSVELMPDISSSKITVTINVRGGIPPTEIESGVTRLVEEVVGDIDSLEEILSMSREGRSQVVVKFKPGTDMDIAAMEIRERYDRIKNKLPREVEKPIIAKYEEGDEPIVILALTSKMYSPEALRKIVDEKIKSRLEKLNGIANIEVYGGMERKILVEANQPRLQAYNMPITQPINMLGASNLNVLAGEVKRTKEKSIIRTLGELESVSEIGKLGVATGSAGNIIRLDDIAQVKDSFFEPKSIARVNLSPAVTMYIQKESGANTIKVSALVKNEVNQIKKDLDENINLEYISDQAHFIEASIKNVWDALIQGAFLSALCLWFFLGDLRITPIIVVSIPISVIATFSIMFFRGISLNVMSLSGLALGVGMLVDNSIVVIENIIRKTSTGFKSYPAIISGTQEVLLAIAASTFTAVIVFLPLVFVNKSIQMLYGGFVQTIVYSLIISLVVAIFLIPMLISRIKIDTVKTSKMDYYMKMHYRKLFTFLFRHKAIFFAVLLAAFAVSVILFTRMDKEFISPLEEGRFTIFTKMEAGAKLSLIDEMTKKVEEVVDSVPELEKMSVYIEDWSSRVYVALLPLNKRSKSVEAVIAALRPKFKELEKNYKGGFIYFSEAEQASKAREVVVDLFGYNYDVLDKLVSAVGGQISKINGMVDIKRSIEEGRPELRVEIDRKKAALFGLSVQGIADGIHAQIRGLRATYYRTTSGDEIEVVVRLEEKYRDTFDKIKKLTLTGSAGQQVYLEQVASFSFGTGPAEIWRKDKRRMIQVSSTSTKLSLDAVTTKLKKSLSGIKFPKDYFYRFGGSYDIMQKNKQELTFAMFLTLLLVYMVMASLYESYSEPFIIMFSVPLALMGAIFALWLLHKEINMGVAAGALVAEGIAVNHAIILVDHIGYLRKKGLGLYRAAIQSGQDRLRPILMTSLTTILGMLPLALSKSEGATLWAPLGITVMASMIGSTFLVLFVIPIVYFVFESVFVRRVRDRV